MDAEEAMTDADQIVQDLRVAIAKVEAMCGGGAPSHLRMNIVTFARMQQAIPVGPSWEHPLVLDPEFKIMGLRVEFAEDMPDDHFDTVLRQRIEWRD
jgi:hypothetical protein